MLPRSQQLHLATRVGTLEEGHGRAGAGSHAEDVQALNGVLGERSQELTALKTWCGPGMLGPGAGKPESALRLSSQPMET